MLFLSPTSNTSTEPQVITHDGKTIAIIVRASFSPPGVTFVTPDDFSQQLAYIRWPDGKTIPSHVHNPVHRDITYTLEVLFIRKGKMRVDLYTNERTYIESHILNTGDVIFLASGGHGFEMLGECDFIEVKQGPYSGDHDKTRFPGVDPSHIVIKSR